MKSIKNKFTFSKLFLAATLCCTVFFNTAKAQTVIASGTTGTLPWQLTSDSTLTISGSGAMPSYSSTNQPWYSIRTKIKSVIIGDSVTSIGQYAFYGCSNMAMVSIGYSVTSVYNSSGLNNSASITVVNFNARNMTTADVFYNCTALTTLNIGDSVQIIPDYTFYNTGITTLIIPNNVQSIGASAFYNCHALNSIQFGSSVHKIGNSAFYNCDGLTGALIIPNTIDTIGNYAFYNCNSLTSLTIPNSVDTIGIYAFQNCSLLGSLNFNAPRLPNTNIFSGCTFLTTLNIGNDVTYIGDNVFQNFTNLTSVILGNSLMAIGQNLFSGCTNINTLSIGNSVVSIGNTAFSGCSSLTSVVIPNSVTTIGGSAFQNCTNLTSLTLGKSITSTTSLSSAFYNNSIDTLYYHPINYSMTIASASNGPFPDLRKLVIGDSVTFFPERFFKGCVLLNNIQCNANTPPTIYPNTFDGVASNILVTVPCGRYSTYMTAPWWNGFINLTDNCNSPNNYTVTTISNNLTFGTVAGGGSYSPNSNAYLYAAPKSGNTFLNWADNNTTNPRTVTVTCDTILIAIFGTAVHDTTYGDSIFVSVHDTVLMHDTIITSADTAYIIIHDTILVSIYDTIFKDTAYIVRYDTIIYVHDTIYLPIYQPIHDTLFVKDTVYLPVYVYDTIFMHDTMYIDTCLTSAVGAIYQDENTIDIYPNPAKERATVDFGQYVNGTLLLYDINGKILFSKEIASETEILNLQNLSAGQYIVRVLSGNKIVGKKIILKE
ncbi:MAG: leucine-rich repeat protein [Bacteroidales bacterium]|jgi:hypothetical protein|nr:leucine-rich repeat protein [Bacteroidales bacterium]